MATIAKQAIEVAKMLHDGPPIVMHFPEAAGQSFALGELVFLSSGKVTIYAGGGVILGIALTAASGTADTDIAVLIATADTVFRTNKTGTDTTAVADVGKSFGFTATSAKWHLDESKVGANARALVVGLDTRDAVGDIAGRELFIILGKYRQFDVTS